MLGLLVGDEAIGDRCPEDWASVGPRLEEAWTAKAKEFSPQLPARPHLFDVLRHCGRPPPLDHAPAATMLPPAATASTTTLSSIRSAAGLGASVTSPLALPDRREGARLANRLAAAVAFSHAKTVDLSAKLAEADAEEENAATPKHRCAMASTIDCHQEARHSARSHHNRGKDSPNGTSTKRQTASSLLAASLASLEVQGAVVGGAKATADTCPTARPSSAAALRGGGEAPFPQKPPLSGGGGGSVRRSASSGANTRRPP